MGQRRENEGMLKKLMKPLLVELVFDWKDQAPRSVEKVAPRAEQFCQRLCSLLIQRKKEG